MSVTLIRCKGQKRGKSNLKNELFSLTTKAIWRQKSPCLSTRHMKNGNTRRESIITARQEQEHHFLAPLQGKKSAPCVALGNLQRIVIKRLSLYAALVRRICIAPQRQCLIATNCPINRLFTIHNLGKNTMCMEPSDRKAIRSWETNQVADIHLNDTIKRKSGKSTFSRILTEIQVVSLEGVAAINMRDQDLLITSATSMTRKVVPHWDMVHLSEVDPPSLLLLLKITFHRQSFHDLRLNSIQGFEVGPRNPRWGSSLLHIRDQHMISQDIHHSKVFNLRSIDLITRDSNLSRLSLLVVDMH